MHRMAVTHLQVLVQCPALGALCLEARFKVGCLCACCRTPTAQALQLAAQLRHFLDLQLNTKLLRLKSQSSVQ